MYKCIYKTKPFVYYYNKNVCIGIDEKIISFDKFILENTKIISHYVDDDYYDPCYILENNQILDSRDIIVIEENNSDDKDIPFLLPTENEIIFIKFKNRYSIVQVGYVTRYIKDPYCFPHYIFLYGWCFYFAEELQKVLNNKYSIMAYYDYDHVFLLVNDKYVDITGIFEINEYKENLILYHGEKQIIDYNRKFIGKPKINMLTRIYINSIAKKFIYIYNIN